MQEKDNNQNPVSPDLNNPDDYLNDAPEYPDFSEYSGKDDKDIVILAQEGDTDALDYLLEHYKNFVRAKARSYFLVGGDKEDIIQEGMVGLFKAIRDFKAERTSSFLAFADLCVTCQIKTAIKSATRQKHIPLNSYVSLNKPVRDDESDWTIQEVFSGFQLLNPEEIIIDREQLDNIKGHLTKRLTPLEVNVLNLYLQGLSYQDIAISLGRHEKSVDNALQRVKKKLLEYLHNRNNSE